MLRTSELRLPQLFVSIFTENCFAPGIIVHFDIHQELCMCIYISVRVTTTIEQKLSDALLRKNRWIATGKTELHKPNHYTDIVAYKYWFFTKYKLPLDGLNDLMLMSLFKKRPSFQATLYFDMPYNSAITSINRLVCITLHIFIFK